TGATGGATDRHAVSNVVVNVGQATPTLSIIESSVASGTRAAQGFTFSGTCPSTYTAGPLTNGQTASPALTGAAPGATCTITEASPGTGWNTTVSINGGAAVALAPAPDGSRSTSFPLAAGPNSMTFVNTS